MAENTADEPIALSALQHWMYRSRQCALIHQEQAFTGNVRLLRSKRPRQRRTMSMPAAPVGGRATLMGDCDHYNFTRFDAVHHAVRKILQRPHTHSGIASCSAFGRTTSNQSARSIAQSKCSAIVEPASAMYHCTTSINSCRAAGANRHVMLRACVACARL